MTNEERKKKIVKVIDNWADNAVKTKRSGASVYDPYNAAELADALIAAGIGEVEQIAKERDELKAELHDKVDYIYEQDEIIKDYKHRAARAERALKDVCANVIKDEEDDIAIEPRARLLYKAYLRQAEKELAEEGK